MIEKAIAFLDNLTLEELDKLTPARQRKFAELCRHWMHLAERRLEQKPRAGVLRELKDGGRSF